MSILSEFMRFLDGFGRSGDSLSNNADGFASNESGTRQQYAWASRREASAASHQDSQGVTVPHYQGDLSALSHSRWYASKIIDLYMRTQGYE